MYLDVNPFVLGPARSEFKRCTKCGEHKSRDQFSRHSRSSDGLQSVCKDCNRKYRQTNAAHRREYQLAYNQANAAAIQERKRIYRQENAEWIREYERNRRIVNAEQLHEYIRKYRQVNSTRIRELVGKYRQTLKGKAVERTHGQRRRARIQSLPASFTTADWQIALNHFGNACAVCGQGLMFYSHGDHWIPLASPDCPGTVPHNMVPLCSTCNLSKRDKPPADWLTERFGKRKGRAILMRVEAFLNSRRPDSEQSA